jgi:hypothetical protein
MVHLGAMDEILEAAADNSIRFVVVVAVIVGHGISHITRSFLSAITRSMISTGRTGLLIIVAMIGKSFSKSFKEAFSSQRLNFSVASIFPMCSSFSKCPNRLPDSTWRNMASIVRGSLCCIGEPISVLPLTIVNCQPPIWFVDFR